MGTEGRVTSYGEVRECKGVSEGESRRLHVALRVLLLLEQIELLQLLLLVVQVSYEVHVAEGLELLLRRGWLL